MTTYLISAITAVTFISAGFFLYVYLWFKHRVLRENASLVESVVDMISHVPEPHAGPGPHVFAGVLFVVGASLGASTILADVVAPENEFIPYLFSSSGLLIGIAFSTIAMWTLWQARRLEFQVGYKIHDFYHLIEQLNIEMENILSSLRENYQMKPQPFHRVYLITTQPFFGMLSYKNSEAANKFRNYLIDCGKAYADSIKDNIDGNNERVFEYHIICGDQEAIKKFHENFYATSGFSDSDVDKATADVEIEIKQISEKTTVIDQDEQEAQLDSPFIRVEEVPNVQFMIVGNKLFEFTLESGNSHSEIFNTQVVHDRRYCEAYIENFKLLTSYMVKK